MLIKSLLFNLRRSYNTPEREKVNRKTENKDTWCYQESNDTIYLNRKRLVNIRNKSNSFSLHFIIIIL